MNAANTVNDKKKLNLGGAIKHYRLMSGMSQLALAERCGFQSQSRISHYENNTREPSTEDLAAICKVLGIDAGTLYRQAGVSAGQKAPTNSSPHHAELQRLFDQLPLEQQFLVMEFMKTLLGDPSEALERLSSL